MRKKHKIGRKSHTWAPLSWEKRILYVSQPPLILFGAQHTDIDVVGFLTMSYDLAPPHPGTLSR
jgi:hypothetical protein